MAARCSRFGCAFRQNQTGSSSNASKADDCVTLATTGLHLPSSEKSSKYLTIFPAATARAIISSPLTIAYHRSLACLVAQTSPLFSAEGGGSHLEVRHRTDSPWRTWSSAPGLEKRRKAAALKARFTFWASLMHD